MFGPPASTASVFIEGGLEPGHLARGLALLAHNTLPLLAVGRYPLVVVAVFCMAYPLWLEAGHNASIVQSLPALVAVYAVGAWDKPVWIGTFGLIAPIWTAGVAIGNLWNADTVEVGYIAPIYFVGWGLGAAMTARRSYAVELRRTIVHAVRRTRPLRFVVDLRDLEDLDAINLGTLAAAYHLGDDHRVAVFLDYCSREIAERLTASGVPGHRLRHVGPVA